MPLQLGNTKVKVRPLQWSDLSCEAVASALHRLQWCNDQYYNALSETSQRNALQYSLGTRAEANKKGLCMNYTIPHFTDLGNSFRCRTLLCNSKNLAAAPLALPKTGGR